MRKTSLIVLILLLVGVIGVANAQEVLLKGGGGFDDAVKLETGNYGGEVMKKGESEYFYINVKSGQEIKIEGVIIPNGTGEGGLTLYDEDRKQLVEEGAIVEEKKGIEQFTISWLSNSDRDSYKYYLKRYCNWVKIGSLSFELSLADRYDAGSQTDAGDTVEKAMEITSGEYRAYLSGKAGADTKDFYKVAVKKGKTLIVKVTPPSEAIIGVAVYDKDRRVLKDEYAPNPGAIVTNSLAIAKSGDVFVGVVCDRYCSKELVAYTLNITTEGEAIVGEEDEDVFAGAGMGAPEDAAEKKGLNWWLILGIILGVIALIVIFATIAYFLLRKGKNGDKEQQKVEEK